MGLWDQFGDKIIDLAGKAGEEAIEKEFSEPAPPPPLPRSEREIVVVTSDSPSVDREQKMMIYSALAVVGLLVVLVVMKR